MHLSLPATPDASRLTPYSIRLSLGCLFLAGCGVMAIASEALAVPRESQEEKEVNLKQQATGGLFQKWTFDQDQPQKAPAGFTALASGEGRPAEWTVQTYADAPSPTQVVAVSSLCEAEPCDHLLLATGFKYEYPDLACKTPPTIMRRWSIWPVLRRV
jgi:hypothetical protein